MFPGTDELVTELQVTLLEVEPPVWRRVVVPGDLTLADLHLVLQAVMGWENLHLHQFETATGMSFAARDPERDPDWAERRVRDATDVLLEDVLTDVGSTLAYGYDFVDGWEHRIELVVTRSGLRGERVPRCIAGARACPPEDCGGPSGYAELLEALADTAHEQHADVTAWLTEVHDGAFDPDAFDLAEANGALRGLSL